MCAVENGHEMAAGILTQSLLPLPAQAGSNDLQFCGGGWKILGLLTPALSSFWGGEGENKNGVKLHPTLLPVI